jgi:hypothetical protein
VEEGRRWRSAEEEGASSSERGATEVVVVEEEEEEGRRWRSAEGEERRKAHHHGRRGDGYGACRRRCASRRNAGKSAPVGGGRLFDGASFESGVALERAEWRVALGEGGVARSRVTSTSSDVEWCRRMRMDSLGLSRVERRARARAGRARSGRSGAAKDAMEKGGRRRRGGGTAVVLCGGRCACRVSSSSE